MKTKTQERVKDLALRIAATYNFKLHKVNDKTYTLWDNYEALLGIVDFEDKVGLSFSYSLEKVSLAKLILQATNIVPDLILMSPFYFDYRDNILYKNEEARTQFEDAEFYYALRSKAQGGKI